MVKRKSGFTLIEVLLTVAIVGIIAAVTPPLISKAVQFFILGKTKIQLQEEARGAMYIITRELRQAQSSTITIDEVTNQPYYSRISFVTIEGSTTTVSQNGSYLSITKGTDTSILSKNLAYLAFTFPHSDDMTIVSVSMTLQEQIYGGIFKALHMASEKVRIMN